MKIASWNVNSIRARLDRALDWIESREPDVLCLQETKVEDDSFPAEPFGDLGYDLVHFGQPTYNGVAILTREPFTDVERGFGRDDLDEQARFVAATVGGVHVASVYVPNGQSVDSDKFVYKLAWLGGLADWVRTRTAEKRPLLLLGDFNVAPEPRDVHDPAAWEGQVLCTDEERDALRKVLEPGLVDVVRRLHPDETIFSWWDYRALAFPKNRGLRIDHAFATEDVADRVRTAGVDREARKGKQPSDHAPVVVELD